MGEERPPPSEKHTKHTKRKMWLLSEPTGSGAEFAPNTLLGGMNTWDNIRILMDLSSHLSRNRLLERVL